MTRICKKYNPAPRPMGVPLWVWILGGMGLAFGLSMTSKKARTAVSSAASTVKQSAATAVAKVKSAINFMQWTQEQKLGSLDPAFRKKVENILAGLKKMGYKPRIDSAWRDQAYQAELVKKGASKTSFSWHNVTDAKGNPSAMAVDFIDNSVFVNKKWDDNAKFFKDLGTLAKKEGLVWGGDWKGLVDKPHVQMYPDTKLAQYKAVTQKALVA